MKVGDLVIHATGDIGIVQRIDYQHYGARQAFKVYDAKRGQCLHPKMVNGIGPTTNGIQNRVLVLFSSNGEMVYSYTYSNSLEVISESR